MTNLFRKIVGIFLGLSMTAGVGIGVAAGNTEAVRVEATSQTVTFTPGTDTGETSVTKSGVTATMTTMNNASYYQIYAGQSGTFSISSGTITEISFECTASGTSKYGPGNASANVGSYSYSGNVGTWTGSSDSITISSTAQIRMTTLSITYDSSGDTPIPESTLFVIIPSDGTAIEASDYTINKLPISVSVNESTLTSDQIRVFKGKTISISGTTFKKIVFTCTANGTTKYGPGCFAAQEGYSYSGKTGTWEGSSDSISFTAESNQVRITEIAIYITANGFLSMFNSKLTCVNNPGTHSFAEGYSWTIFKNVYSSLDNGEKELVKEDAATMAKYDYIVGKYGTTTYEDFIGRNLAAIGSRVLLSPVFNNVNSSTAIIIILSLISISTLVLFVIVKKRKEN